jgi:hypothetical protein
MAMGLFEKLHQSKITQKLKVQENHIETIAVEFQK